MDLRPAAPQDIEMPELPEAETIARDLDRQLAGCRLGRVRLTRRDIVHGDPRSLASLLRGRVVERVRRRAKRVILDLSSGVELVFHLGMSGRLTVVSPDAEPEPHTHLRIATEDGARELRFRDPRRFGGVWCLAGGKRSVGRKLGELGVEPLETSVVEFRKLLSSRQRQIKALLLDQKVIAGLGNIYCDESLFGAGVHPLTPSHTLDAATTRRLLRTIKSTLRRAIQLKGSTLVDYRQADGSKGGFQDHHRVYQRVGIPCQRCGTKIERIRVAGRSTFICPCCQPAPSPLS